MDSIFLITLIMSHDHENLEGQCDFRGTWNQVLGIFQGLQASKLIAGMSLQNTALFPHPTFLHRSLKSSCVSTSAAYMQLDTSRLSACVLLLHKCENVQVTIRAVLLKAVKEHSRTFTASSIVLFKQLAPDIVFGANVGRVKTKQLHE